MGLRKKDRDMQQEILLRKKNWKRAYIIEILYLYNLITQKFVQHKKRTKKKYVKMINCFYEAKIIKY